MEIDNKDESPRICDEEGYYQFEKVIISSGERVVRAAYYSAEDEFDPVKTATVPNPVLVELFRLTVLNDLVDDKDALAHVLEEILQSISRQWPPPVRTK